MMVSIIYCRHARQKKSNIGSNNSLSKNETLSKEVTELTKLRNKLLV